jgi:LacI family transcriptional regulator
MFKISTPKSRLQWTAARRTPRRGTTIKDIAPEAGVSIATVSKALSGGKSGMAEKTREKILEISKRLDYYPNLRARGLVAKKPEAIGIVIPRTSEFAFSNPYYAELLKGIGSRAREAGQHLLFFFAGKGNYAQLYHHRLAAGIIVLGNRMDDPLIEEAWRMKVPIVLIPGSLNQENIPSVDGDNRAGAFEAVGYLASLGHRRIAFLNGPLNSKYCVERLEGYRRALAKNGLAFQESLVLESDFSQDGAYQNMKKLLSLSPAPTAILVINDYSALGALRAAKEMSFQVPEDLPVVGFGDVPFASMLSPPLTTIREPFQRMGQEATDRLLGIIQGKRLSPKNRILPVELVIRESCAAGGRSH